MRSKTRYLIGSIVFAIVVISGGELVARYSLGLGNPPLLVTHPTIEYMYRPDQNVYRFGNLFLVNQYGMRARSFPVKKDDDELRIMIFGDSVVNGGGLTDHEDLATTIVNERLLKLVSRDVVVGNISAGSWGPGNWLAYAQEYGFFGADIVILVISSHDFTDNPSFKPLDKLTHPTKRPVSALFEGITRYLPRYLPKLGSSDGEESDESSAQKIEQRARKGLEDLKNFLQLALGQSDLVLVYQHWDKYEMARKSARPGNQRIKEVCEQLGIAVHSLAPYFSGSIEKGENPYRDNIHPNKIGQQLIAEAIIERFPNKVIYRDGTIDELRR